MRKPLLILAPWLVATTVIAAASAAIACGGRVHRVHGGPARRCCLRVVPCGGCAVGNWQCSPREMWREIVHAYVRDLESGRQRWPDTGPQQIRKRFARYTSNSAVIVQALTDVLLHDSSSLFRDRAANLIGRLRDPAAATQLRTAISDPDSGVRAHVCLALGEIGDRAASGKLQNVLRNEKDPLVRRCAAQSLERLADPASATALASTLKNDTDNDVRRDAADALGAVGGTVALDALNAAISDRDQAVRAASEDALERLGALRLPLPGDVYEPIDRSAYESLRSRGRVRRATVRDGVVYFEVDEPLDVSFGGGVSGWFNQRHWYRTDASDEGLSEHSQPGILDVLSVRIVAKKLQAEK